MQIVYGGNLHEMSNPVFWEKLEKEKNISKCRLLNFLPSVLSVKQEKITILSRSIIFDKSLTVMNRKYE